MKVDQVSLVSGTAIVVLGVLVLVDSADAIEVSGGWGAVVLTGILGVIFLISGLMDRGADRRDRPHT
jgi:hypothetical protein